MCGSVFAGPVWGANCGPYILSASQQHCTNISVTALSKGDRQEASVLGSSSQQ